MLDLFIYENNDINYPIQAYGKFDYLKKKYRENLKKTKEYYYHKEEAVDNRHLLNKIINDLTPNIEHNDIIDYLRIVSVSAELYSKQHGIVSNINFGNILSNVFYGKNSREILLYTSTEIDIFTIEENWKDLTSVRVIYHEDTDMFIPRPIPLNYVPGSLVVMEIDIILLLLQYRCWYLERLSLDMSTNINIFISQIVMTNMMDNILDIALVNRYNYISRGVVPYKDINNHPFLLIDYTDKLDDVIKTIIRDNKNKSIPLERLLKSLPAIAESTVNDVLHIRHKYYTMQSKWVLWVSRVSYIDMFLHIIGVRGIRRNKDILNKLPVVLKRLERSSVLNKILDENTYKKFYIEIEDILKKIKK